MWYVVTSRSLLNEAFESVHSAAMLQTPFLNERWLKPLIALGISGSCVLFFLSTLLSRTQVVVALLPIYRMPERNDIVYFLSSSRVPKASMVDMIVLEGCAAVEESIMAAGVEI
jgi:hypothetical protein